MVQVFLLGVVRAYQKHHHRSLGSARRRAKMLQPSDSEREENGAGERGDLGDLYRCGEALN
jgi:hypothetical protein